MRTDSDDPLFKLTVSQHTKLIREIIADVFPQLYREYQKGKVSSEEDVILIKDASELTGLQPSTIHSKVSRGQMPALSRGKPLRFSRKALLNWMDQGKPSIYENAANQLLTQQFSNREKRTIKP